MIDIMDKSKCTGCSACYSACSVGCISMQQDDEGFYYPVVDNVKCIECGKCEKICPVLNKTKPDSDVKKVYVCQNKSTSIRTDSTSGGVFSAISQYVLDNEGIVFGAEFDENFRVVHGYAVDEKGLGRFRGSKYVQSWIGNTFKRVQEELRKGRWVLFSGTPCQVAGLNAYLGKKYDKLILMDIVCYSVSSPGIWNMYLSHIEKMKKLKPQDIEMINFRDKTRYGYDYSFMTFYGKNGKVLLSEGAETNQMLRSFVSNTSTCSSCYQCQFKGIDRMSDFTAWDCYNAYQYNKNFEDNLGTSHLMVHSQKALKILPEIERYLNLYEVKAEKAIASEPAMTECSRPSKLRESFFIKYKAGNNVFDTCFQDNIRIKAERILRHSMSRLGIYKIVKRILKEV